jgi:hypothetical protein
LSSANGKAVKDESSLPLASIKPVYYWFAALILCALFAMTRCFTSLATYDDESYIMLTLQSFLQGHRLYGETYTQYGPAYYLLQTPIHGWFDLPISHDIVRIKTVITWVAVSFLSGMAVLRITGKQLIGVASMLLVMLHLEKLGLEPAHPQEIVALLAASGLLLMGRQSRYAMLLAGICAAFAGLTKLNIGATMAASFLFAASWNGIHSNRHDRILLAISSALCCLLPVGILLMVANKGMAGSEAINMVWPVGLVIATMLVCWTAWQNLRIESAPQELASTSSTNKNFYWIALGGLLGTVGVIGWSLAGGNSFDELAWGVLFQHTFMSESFYGPVIPTTADIALGLVAAGVVSAGLWWKQSNRESKALESWLSMLPVVGLSVALLMLVVECYRPIEHGLSARGAARFLTSVGPFLMPCLLLRKTTTLRLALAMSGCLSSLLAFPVPGTQVALGTVPVLLALVVGTYDSVQIQFQQQRWSQLVLKFAGPVVAVALLVSTIAFGYRWTVYTPLDQPGCQWVRLEDERASLEKNLANAIRETPGEFLAFDLQNHNRFFFWTGKKPVTPISPTFWPRMLTEEQQLTIRDQFNFSGDVCVVKIPDCGVELDQFCPEIAEVMLLDWQENREVSQWRVGLRAGK